MKEILVVFFSFFLIVVRLQGSPLSDPKDQSSDTEKSSLDQLMTILNEKYNKAYVTAIESENRINNFSIQIVEDMRGHARDSRFSWAINRLPNFLSHTDSVNISSCYEIPDVYDTFARELVNRTDRCLTKIKNENLLFIKRYNETVGYILNEHSFKKDALTIQVHRCYQNYNFTVSRFSQPSKDCIEEVRAEVQKLNVNSDLDKARSDLKNDMIGVENKMNTCRRNRTDDDLLAKHLTMHEDNFMSCQIDKLKEKLRLQHKVVKEIKESVTV